MQITDIKIRRIRNEKSNLKAFASIVFDDCFVVHDIKIVEASEGAMISMPSRKGSDGEHKDIAHPINRETRDYIKRSVLEKYKEELEKV